MFSAPDETCGAFASERYRDASQAPSLHGETVTDSREPVKKAERRLGIPINFH